MENATKALLIAAAILIVIVVIALGVRILNTAQNPADSAQTVGIDLQTGANTSQHHATNAITDAWTNL